MATNSSNARQSARLSADHHQVTDIRVVSLSGELDADSAEEFLRAVRPDDAGTSWTVLDLSAVTFMDSSAVNVLVAARRDVTAAGGWIRLAAPTDPVLRVIEIVGLDTIFDCYPTLNEALHP
ncbi:STAS domain-containing protein [Streptomyces sp. NPDC102487]|uniref:STAS domain-containing protein n=1 Tax=Streptomyces sp. NPDC102487 TaxID=3366182 RepID=UPI00381AC393